MFSYTVIYYHLLNIDIQTSKAYLNDLQLIWHLMRVRADLFIQMKH